MAKRRCIVKTTTAAAAEPENQQPSPSSNEQLPAAVLVQVYHEWMTCDSPSTPEALEKLYLTTKAFRRLSCRDERKNDAIKDIVECQAVPYLVMMLQDRKEQEHQNLVFEAVWALTNISSSKYAYVVAESEAVSHLTRLLLHDYETVREQAAWCIGNLAGDNNKYRDWLLNINGLTLGM